MRKLFIALIAIFALAACNNNAPQNQTQREAPPSVLPPVMENTTVETTESLEPEPQEEEQEEEQRQQELQKSLLFGDWLDTEGDYWTFYPDNTGLDWDGDPMTWTLDGDILSINHTDFGFTTAIELQEIDNDSIVIKFLTVGDVDFGNIGNEIAMTRVAERGVSASFELEFDFNLVGRWLDDDGDFWEFFDDGTGIDYDGDHFAWILEDNVLILIYDEFDLDVTFWLEPINEDLALLAFLTIGDLFDFTNEPEFFGIIRTQ